ncbi:a g-specific adenine glycosylase [Plasmopara halstedii]|uniref:Adenine DNA glycosylase n=1 Tax=Plasmopara halstedii TaxID=4781 RepID=A0A0P1A791_PLAHL|nr:a g-specific adenine glycosylase [Plasmopara halstedii]CEG36348.1 a g-specific adenine glycosylase [Plasmopara halstedii]|eukprot:XP_024572717.1 a g-specific adenine glycosylase [Plasmopara halstedii]
MLQMSPSGAAANQPEIEDLINYKTYDADTSNATFLMAQHDASKHNFLPQELLVIRTELLTWYDTHRRKLPWRGDLPPYLTTATHTSLKKEEQATLVQKKIDAFLKKEVTHVSMGKEDVTDSRIELKRVSPYETWVSEVMLQQTRVDTVVQYFLRWIDKFPTIAALAFASEEDVNALWAGLGYYRRARMLHAGAKFVVEKYGGELPSTVEKLREIPGIGPYTAGAIASIAFGNREPLVDGNVIRILARMRAVGADPKNRHLIDFSWKAAKQLVSECDSPGSLNQALMELGATMCTIQNPQCSSCPVKSICLAYAETNSDKRKVQDFPNDSIATSSDICAICDYTRVTEWDKTHAEVTKYPLKAKKNESRNEVIAVAVVSAPLDLPRDETLTGRKRKVTTSAEVSSAPSSWRYLMSKRPEGGLLGGQWEFLHNKVGDGDKIPSFSKRKAFMDARLNETFGKIALTTSANSIIKRSDLGKLTHVFSHIKHHMGVEHVHFESQPELLEAAKSPKLRWMTVAEMKQQGITTGVKKILKLVLQPERKVKSKVDSSPTQFHTSHNC